MARRDAGDTEAAAALLGALAASYPRSPYAAEARRVIAAARGATETAEEADRTPLTASELRGLAAAYRAAADASAGTPQGRDALYQLAVVLDNLGDLPGAVAAWEEFLRRYPDDERVPEVLYGLGYIHQVTLRDVATARRHYRRLVDRYPGTRFAAAAEEALRDLEREGATPAPPTPPTAQTPPGEV